MSSSSLTHSACADKFVLSVKGGITAEFAPNGTIEFLREEVEKINRILKHRKMDMYEVARLDTKTGIETVRLARVGWHCAAH